MTQHILDERATNAIIHERKHDNGHGITLCGKRVMLVQRVPDRAVEPTFLEEGINWKVRRFYSDTFTVDHWFNHRRAGGWQVCCLNCIREVEKVTAEERKIRT